MCYVGHYCFVLFCTVCGHIVSCCIVLYDTVFVALCCTILYSMALYFVALCWCLMVWNCVVLVFDGMVLCCIGVRCTVLCCIGVL